MPALPAFETLVLVRRPLLLALAVVHLIHLELLPLHLDPVHRPQCILRISFTVKFLPPSLLKSYHEGVRTLVSHLFDGVLLEEFLHVLLTLDLRTAVSRYEQLIRNKVSHNKI